MTTAHEKFKALWPSVQSMREMIADSYAANMNASDEAVLTLADEIDRIDVVNADLLAALQEIVALENTESNEWDGVERLIPEMCDIARAAIAKAVQA